MSEEKENTNNTEDIQLTHHILLYFNPKSGHWLCKMGSLKPYEEDRVHIQYVSGVMKAAMDLLSQKMDENGFVMTDKEWNELLKQKEEKEERKKSFAVIDGDRDE